MNIMEVLNDLDGGLVKAEMQEEFDKVVAGVRRTHRPGVVTIKLEVAPTAINDDREVYQIGVKPKEIQGKEPKREMAQSRYFFGDGGALQRRDPRQPDIPGMVDGKGSQSETPEDQQEAAGG